MKQAADGGLGAIGVKTPPAESSAEIFEQRKQAGMDQLRETIAKAFEGASDDQALDRIASLARERAEDVRTKLQELQESIREEGSESVVVSLGEGVDEAIQGLDREMQDRVREAVAAFERNIVDAVRASVGRGAVETRPALSEMQETADQKIARLQKEIVDLEAKQQKRKEKTGVGPLVREGQRLKGLQEELDSLKGQGKTEDGTDLVRSAESVSTEAAPVASSEQAASVSGVTETVPTPSITELAPLPDAKADKRAKLVAQLEALQKDVAALQKARGGKGRPGMKETLLLIRAGQLEADVAKLDTQAASLSGAEEVASSVAEVKTPLTSSEVFSVPPGEKEHREKRLAARGPLLQNIQTLLDQIDPLSKVPEEVSALDSLVSLVHTSDALREADALIVAAKTEKEYELAQDRFRDAEKAISTGFAELVRVKRLFEQKAQKKFPRAKDAKERAFFQDRATFFNKALQITESVTSLLGLYREIPPELVKTPSPDNASVPGSVSTEVSKSPDPVVPPDASSSPDVKPAASPDAKKLSRFEETLAEDEKRLEKIKGLMSAWVDPVAKGEPPMMKDMPIRRLVEWYGKMISAERALADASATEKGKKREALRAIRREEPQGEDSLEKLTIAFAGFLESKNQSKYSPEWRAVLESRQAVLTVLNESLEARQKGDKDSTPSPSSDAAVTPAPVAPPISLDTKPAPSPDATKKSVFEERVESDEARLKQIDALIAGWSAGETTPEDANIKAIANWYNEVWEADKTLVAAADQKVRGRASEEIARRIKKQPSGDASLENVQARLDALLAAATTDVQKTAIESRKAVLALVAEGKAAQGLKAGKVSDVPAPTPSTPDTSPPSVDTSSPDPGPAAPEGPEHGPKTLQEAFEQEDALFRRLTTLVGSIEPLSEINDAPLQEFVARLAESLPIFEKIVKSTDPDEQLKLSAERTGILERGDVRLQAEAYAEELYEAMDEMSLEEIVSEPGIVKRVEVLEGLVEVFPPIAEFLPSLKSKLEAAAKVKPLEGSGDSLEALLARDEALIRTLEKLTLASSNIEMLDDPEEGQSHGELDRVLLGTQRAFDVLQEAARETDPKRRRELLIQRKMILEDPNLKASAQAYLKNMAVMLREVDPDALKEDTEMDTRVKIMEALTQLFPDLVTDIEAFKGEKRNAELLPFEQRTQWESFVREKEKQNRTLRGVLAEAKDDSWYAANKASIEAGLTYQEGLVERAQRLLDAKTPKEREAADRELVRFRRTIFSVGPLVKNGSREKTKEALEKIGEEIQGIKVSDQEEAKRKAAIEAKQKEVKPLERLLEVFRLQDSLTKEAMLPSMPIEEELYERQKRARQENLYKTDEEKKAPESVEGIVKGMHDASEQQMKERIHGVKLAEGACARFSEELQGYKPHKEIETTFSPLYRQWAEGQQASLRLLQVERRYNLLDHLEMGATRALRLLDRVGSPVDAEEVRTLWHESSPMIRDLIGKGEDEEAFVASFVSGTRTVEQLKSSFYEILRRVTQDKVTVGKDMEEALEKVGSMDGRMEHLIERAQELADRELVSLDNSYRALLLERDQKKPGGPRHTDVRWSEEGPRLEYNILEATQARGRIEARIKDLNTLQEILRGRHAVEDPSAEDVTVAFELRQGPSEQIIAIMHEQMVRSGAMKVDDEVRVKFLNDHPGIMNKAIMSNPSSKKSVEPRADSKGSGKVAGSVLEGNWGWKKIKESLKMLWPFGE